LNITSKHTHLLYIYCVGGRDGSFLEPYYALPYSDWLTPILRIWQDNHFFFFRDKKEREMSVVMETMTGHPLPEDVVIEILSRLPVKNL